MSDYDLRLPGNYIMSSFCGPSSTSFLKQGFQVHREEIFCTDTSISNNERVLRIEEFAECFQTLCLLLRIALDLNGNKHSLFA